MTTHKLSNTADRVLVVRQAQEGGHTIAAPNLERGWDELMKWLEGAAREMIERKIEIATPAHPLGGANLTGLALKEVTKLSRHDATQRFALLLNLTEEDLEGDNLLDLFFAIDDILNTVPAKDSASGTTVRFSNDTWRRILRIEEVYDGQDARKINLGIWSVQAQSARLPPPGMLRLSTTLNSQSTHARARMQIAKDPNYFAKLDIALRTKRDIALTAVKADGQNLQYVGKELRNDAEVVRAAVAQDPKAFAHAGQQARNNLALAGFAVERLSDNWNLLPKTFQTEAMAHRLADGYINAGFDRTYGSGECPVGAFAFASVAGRILTHFPKLLSSVPADVRNSPALQPAQLLASTWSRPDSGGTWSVLLEQFPVQQVANAELWAQINELTPGFAILYPIVAEVSQLGRKERQELTRRLQKHQITRIDRFDSLATLNRMLDLRDHPNQLKKPVRLFISARADHNGALSNEVSRANHQRYINAGDTLYFEVETRTQFIRAWKALGTSPVVRHIEAHGQQDHLHLGGDNGKDALLSVNDLPELEVLELDTFVAAGSRIIIDACLTAAGTFNASNVANLFGHLAPGATVVAAQEEVTGFDGSILVADDRPAATYTIEKGTDVTVLGEP